MLTLVPRVRGNAICGNVTLHKALVLADLDNIGFFFAYSNLTQFYGRNRWKRYPLSRIDKLVPKKLVAT